MRVSVVNFCSTRPDMLDFSSRMLTENAGTDFDYFVVTWLANRQVAEWLENPPVSARRLIHHTVDGLAYVPQLRAMMNHGFGWGYEVNDWVALVNTDMAFGRNWLRNLVKWAAEAGPGSIVNSTHITPVEGTGNVITRDLGVTVEGTFLADEFWRLHDELYVERVEWEEERGGWEQCATFPYLLHRSWWEQCGPWSPIFDGTMAPDRQFFRRCHEGGARFGLAHDSIVYHHEAVERRGARPPGAEHLAEGA
jgi:hypothetical protein